jgi:hypothetical protein
MTRLPALGLLGLLLGLLLAPGQSEAASFEEALGVPRLDLAGTFGVQQDDFVRRAGPGFRLGLRPIRLIGLDLLITGMPNRGTDDLTSRVARLQNVEASVPNISRVLSMTHVGVSLAPLVGRVRDPRGGDPGEVAWFFVLGGGAMTTLEDVLLTNNPCADLEPREWAAGDECTLVAQTLPAAVFGTGLRLVLGGGFLIGFEARLALYTEQSLLGGELVLEGKRFVWLSVTVGGSIPLLFAQSDD